MSHETPGGEWKWRVILQRGSQYEEVLVKRLQINVPPFSQDDEMLMVGRKFHIVCYGAFRVEDGMGILIQKSNPGSNNTAPRSIRITK